MRDYETTRVISVQLIICMQNRKLIRRYLIHQSIARMRIRLSVGVTSGSDVGTPPHPELNIVSPVIYTAKSRYDEALPTTQSRRPKAHPEGLDMGSLLRVPI